MSSPKISVIMSVYNTESLVGAAIESILNQDFKNFEFIIIDDASTDGSRAIVQQYAAQDPHIVFLQNTQNMNLAYSLNRGLDVAHGEYIARMDADDIAMPDRLSRQLAYLDTHIDIGVVGSDMIYIDIEGQPLDESKPVYDNQYAPSGFVRWALLWHNVLPHPTLMIRRSVLDAYNLRYNPDFDTAQDYDFLARVGEYTSLMRLPDVLLKKRVVETAITTSRRLQQIQASYIPTRRALRAYVGDVATEPGLRAVYAAFAEGVSSAPAPPYAETLLDGERSTAADLRNAVDIVVKAYRRYMQEEAQYLSALEKQMVHIHMLERLRSIAIKAGRQRSAALLYIMGWWVRLAHPYDYRLLFELLPKLFKKLHRARSWQDRC